MRICNSYTAKKRFSKFSSFLMKNTNSIFVNISARKLRFNMASYYNVLSLILWLMSLQK